MFHGLLLMYLCFPHSLSFPASGILSDGYDTTGQGDGFWGNFRREICPAPPRRAIVGVQSDESRQRGHFASVQSDKSRQRGHFADAQRPAHPLEARLQTCNDPCTPWEPDCRRAMTPAPPGSQIADAQRPAHPLEARLQTCNLPLTPLKTVSHGGKIFRATRFL